MFSRTRTTEFTETFSDKSEKIEKLRLVINTADKIIIGAGSGLSTAAGFIYFGERFERYFFDFKQKYNIRDMYSGGFYPFPNLEEYWGWWARHIYINRYMPPANNVYANLFSLVKDKDFFVLTTNVDHHFQFNGFDKKRLFYTQGDYGLWQCSDPCHEETYDNGEIVYKMLLSEGFLKEENESYAVVSPMCWKTSIDSSLVPKCPKCGKPMTMNLRCDNTFVQDNGWYEAEKRYSKFIADCKNLKVLYLEIGVGMNTPVIIKYPFLKMTYENPNAFYGCLNIEPAYVPEEIKNRSVCINADVAKVIKKLS